MVAFVIPLIGFVITVAATWLIDQYTYNMLLNSIDQSLADFLSMFVPGMEFDEFIGLSWIFFGIIFVLIYVGLYIMIVPPKKKKNKINKGW